VIMRLVTSGVITLPAAGLDGLRSLAPTSTTMPLFYRAGHAPGGTEVAMVSHVAAMNVNTVWLTSRGAGVVGVAAQATFRFLASTRLHELPRRSRSGAWSRGGIPSVWASAGCASPAEINKRTKGDGT
jgi:hypothetical protein